MKDVAHSPRSGSAMALPTRLLGRTNMRITPVGFGAWAIGGPNWAAGWGAQNDRDSIAAVQRAVALGINWIDTAPIYGYGHSEEIVRQALRTISAERRPYIFTKCGLVWDTRERNAPPAFVGARHSIREEVESSLRRLGVERIDLYQMHWPAQDGAALGDYWQTLLELKREGKVRAVGLSNHDAKQLAAAEDLGHVDTLQPRFSAISRDVAATTLPWCRAHETGVIVYSPMHSGLLTGSFDAERAAALPSDDWRSRSAEFKGQRLIRNLALADALRPIADRLSTTVASVAIAWTLAWPGISGAIVGARRPEHVDGWIGAATLELGAQDLDEIATAIRTTRAGHGPASPFDATTETTVGA
jgi:aryl-alcohol dehydrogenase-like predicted oxidoreductase